MGWIRGLALAAVVASALAPVSAAAETGDEIIVHDDSTGLWHLPNGNAFYYGDPADRPLMCDWDGDGVDTVGLYRSSTGFLHLRNSNDQGFSDVQIFYGIPEDLPVCGNWNGDGIDTIGVYRPSEGRFYLRNSNTQGFADLVFELEGVGIPFAGDWDGDGTDTVGLYDPTMGRLVRAAGHTALVRWSGYYGAAGDRFVAGDWNGDGHDEYGVYRPATAELHLGIDAVGGVGEVRRMVASGLPVAARLRSPGSEPAPAPVPAPGNRPPEGVIAEPATDVTIMAGESVELRGAGSDPDGHLPLRFTWHFGGALPAMEGAEPGAVRFETAGEYRVSLTVTDAAGSADPTPATVSISVVASPFVVIEPGQDVQAVVDAHPDISTFVLAAGTHRMQSVRPRDGQSFRGEEGTVMSGARLLSGFRFDGVRWYVDGQSQQGRVIAAWVPSGPVCRDFAPRCNYPEDLWVDGSLLRHVGDLNEVGPGTWFFDYAGDRIYLGEDPAGRTVETSVTESAFSGGANDVTIRNLVVEKYASPGQWGAIDSRGGWTGTGVDGRNWTVDNVELRHNHGAGVHLTDGGRVLNSFIHHNGQQGVSARGVGVLIAGNEIAANNTAGFHYDFEAGGGKLYRTVGLVVRDNYIHHNRLAAGIWADIDNHDALFENNRVEFNDHEGIYYEVSHGAVIRNNYLEGNGHADDRNPAGWLWGAAIEVSSSGDVEVYGNTLVDNHNHIAGIEQERGTGAAGEPRLVENLYVHDNLVVGSGGTGLVTDYGDDSFFTWRNNRFENNRYVMDASDRTFRWDGRHLTFAEWQAYGHDQNGVLESP